MRKLVLLLFGIALLLPVSCTKAQYGNITREEAYGLAMKKLDVSMDEVDIYASIRRLAPGTPVHMLFEDLNSPAKESWLFFVDDVPQANWEHPCRYVFVDVNGNVKCYFETMPPRAETWDLLELVHASDFTKQFSSSEPLQYSSSKSPWTAKAGF